MIQSNMNETIESLDSLINNPARLLIVFHLARETSIEYPRLMALTGLSSGNITTHLQKLTRAGYVRQKKSFIGNKPRTTLSLTDKGHAAYTAWGWQVVAVLPDEVRDSLRLYLKAIPSLIWDQDYQPRHTFAYAEWGARLLPPLLGSFL